MSHVQLVGGPRDGEFVRDCGPVFREPVRRPVRVFYTPEEAITPSVPYEIRYYNREISCDDFKPRYVFETTDLGQPSFRPREDIW